MPRLLTSSKVLRGSVGYSTNYGPVGSKSEEVMVRVYFARASTPTAPVPYAVQHGLRKVPRHWEPVHVEVDTSVATGVAAAPGRVFTIKPWATADRAMFCCDVAGTWADIILR